jgi:hypothetical protein
MDDNPFCRQLWVATQVVGDRLKPRQSPPRGEDKGPICVCVTRSRFSELSFVFQLELYSTKINSKRHPWTEPRDV